MSDLYLEHHGVLGMKWGVRRYQNYDGTLTQMGKVRNKYNREATIKNGENAVNKVLLYHGSKTEIQDELTPHISLEGIPLVYATNEWDYALIRSGKFTNDILVREEHEIGKHTLAEVEPGAFDKTFNRSGYIYELDNSGFKYNYGTEYISNNNSKINKTHKIDNILDELKKSPNIELVPYEGSEEYWSNVRGGREGYKERKMASLKIMNDAIAKAMKEKL